MHEDKIEIPGLLMKDAARESDMELINALAMEPMTAEQVFTFKLAACDDQVDRDCERFTVDTLEAFAKLFPGKPVLMDHSWSARVQIARCYKAEVQQAEEVHRLVLYCYMPKLPQYKDAELAIKSGILRECSVGVGVSRQTCSVCGKDLGRCEHNQGHTYDGELCIGVLEGAVDVYEVSLVAVPAQREAGVIKGAKHPTEDDKTQAERDHRKAAAQARQRLEELRYGGM